MPKWGDLRWSLWLGATLRAKLLFFVLALMVIALALSTVTHLAVSARTRVQLLSQEVESDLGRVRGGLGVRSASVATGARMLAGDPSVRKALSENGPDSLSTLNDRAVVILERLQLDVVQIYAADGTPRTNLLTGDLYRQSGLLYAATGEAPTAHWVEGSLLLLCRTQVSDDMGFVVTGVDVRSEVRDLAAEYRLASAVQVLLDGRAVGSHADELPLTDGEYGGWYARSEAITLGATPATLTVAHDAGHLRDVSLAGLTILLLSLLGTFALVALASVVMSGYLTRPARDLADKAGRLARGEWIEEPVALGEASPGTLDELALANHAFDRMAADLSQLYQGLEAKVAERTADLQDAEQRYRQLVDEDLSAVFISDAHGHISTCNPAFARVFGYGSQSQAVGHCLSELVDAAAFDHLCQQLRAEGRVECPELAAHRLDGRPLQLMVNLLSRRNDAGETDTVLGYIVDISDRRKLEEQLHQSQKMEAIGRLAGGVAHDFNNLLTVIIGYSQLLLGEAQEAGSIAVEDLEQILRAGERAASLTRQLLAFSRKQVLQPRSLNLNVVVQDTAKMLQRLIGEDVALRTNLQGGLPNVLVDPGQMEQVLMNLAVNAREAMPSGGSLTIETQAVNLRQLSPGSPEGLRPGHYVMLAMSDTGTGMDEATRQRIFEPFFTTKSFGTGLGLATVYGVIRQSNGHITVYSEPGMGTTFKVYLPCSEAEAPEDEGLLAQAAPLAPARVLVVEDEEMVRVFTANVLREAGHTVYAAAEGPEALALVPELGAPLDLLITDVVMPGMSGRELATRMQTWQQDLPVLFVSGYTDQAIERHGVLEPGTHFLQKPYGRDALLAMVAHLLGSRFGLREPGPTLAAVPQAQVS